MVIACEVSARFKVFPKGTEDGGIVKRINGIIFWIVVMFLQSGRLDYDGQVEELMNCMNGYTDVE